MKNKAKLLKALLIMGLSSANAIDGLSLSGQASNKDIDQIAIGADWSLPIDISPSVASGFKIDIEHWRSDTSKPRYGFTLGPVLRLFIEKQVGYTLSLLLGEAMA